MFGTNKFGANAYAKVGLETSIDSASPHALISLLFDGADTALQKAIIEMQNGNYAAKGKAVSHAVNIINDGLRSSLDKEKGGAIASNLDSLYAYLTQLIMQGHVRNSVQNLESAQKMLRELHHSWKQIGKSDVKAQKEYTKV